MREPTEYPLIYLTLGIQPVRRRRQFWTVLEIAGALWVYWIIASLLLWMAAFGNPQFLMAMRTSWIAQNPTMTSFPSFFQFFFRPAILGPFVLDTAVALALFWIPIHAGLLYAQRAKRHARPDVISVHPFSGLIAGCSVAVLFGFWMLWHTTEVIREESRNLFLEGLVSASFSQHTKLIGILAGARVLSHGIGNDYRALMIKKNLGDFRLAGFRGREILFGLSFPYFWGAILYSCLHLFLSYWVALQNTRGILDWSGGIPPPVFAAHMLAAFWLCSFFAIPLSVLYHKLVSLLYVALMAMIAPLISVNFFLYGNPLTREEYGAFLRIELILLPIKVFIIARTWRRAILKLEREDVPGVG